MVTFNWRRRASEPLVTTSSHQQILQRETADIAEEEEHAVLEAGSTGHQQEEGLQPPERDNPSLHHLPCNSQDESTSQSGATASNPGLSMAYNESKDVVCGICM
ncbi:hypothetical protein, partial [Salmonella sp. s58079]|uniref:hypothetical protein n=1 Tax=Salmonella sp. s58079 TaxID=3159700 RepID=UPI00398174B6